MLEAHNPNRADTAPDGIEALVARHGALPVLVAVLRALLRRPQLRPPPADPAALTPHLRRDIGLPPESAHARLDALPPLRMPF